MTSHSRALSFAARNAIAAVVISLSAVACAKDATSIAAPTAGIDTPDDPALITVATFTNPMAGASFWVDPNSNAKATANAWRTTRPADAGQMDKIAAQASAKWIGNWNTNVRADVDAAVTTMLGAGATPVFVAYNIPQRDCGGLSGGNTTSAQTYRDWITAFATGIGSRRATVILEPDAIAGGDCLSATDQLLRISLLKFAVQTFAAKGHVAIYLDGGNPHWQSAATMSRRLINAGIGMTQGFALNVSNFYTTSENIAYGSQIAQLVGGKHFIIDTGRNGVGATPDAQWCNPAGRALGARPTTATGSSLVDAFLWVKAPGESDGACNGAPSAGTWMPEYALGLASRASY